MKTAIYIRTATSNPDEQQERIEAQRTACHTAAQAYGLDVTHEFSDVGVSGATMDRPGLDGLRDVIARQIIDALVVVDINRLARRVDDLLALCEECTAHGVVIYLASDADGNADSSDHLQYDTTESFIELYRQMILRRNTLNQNESC
jgi:site-specific DNA recombinase